MNKKEESRTLSSESFHFCAVRITICVVLKTLDLVLKNVKNLQVELWFSRK